MSLLTLKTGPHQANSVKVMRSKSSPVFILAIISGTLLTAGIVVILTVTHFQKNKTDVQLNPRVSLTESADTQTFTIKSYSAGGLEGGKPYLPYRAYICKSTDGKIVKVWSWFVSGIHPDRKNTIKAKLVDNNLWIEVDPGEK